MDETSSIQLTTVSLELPGTEPQGSPQSFVSPAKDNAGSSAVEGDPDAFKKD